jgi:hypothetical protein
MIELPADGSLAAPLPEDFGTSRWQLTIELTTISRACESGQRSLVARRWKPPWPPAGSAVDLAEIANLSATPFLRDRDGIALLRCIDSDESPDMLVHDSPSLFEALPGQSG